MTRRFLLAVALILASAVGAKAAENAVVTIDSVSSTNTIRGIDISSAPATSIVISTNMLYRQVCVQNFSDTSYLACSENVNVSTLTSQNHVGTILGVAASTSAPSFPTCFSISAGTNFYCRTSSVTGSTRAGIARGR